MFNSMGDNFKDNHFQNLFASTSCFNISHLSDFIGAYTTMSKNNLLLCMCKNSLLSNLLKINFAEITHYVNKFMAVFLHIVTRCLTNHKNGKFKDHMTTFKYLSVILIY